MLLGAPFRSFAITPCTSLDLKWGAGMAQWLSICLPCRPPTVPMWPGLDSRTRRHMWVEFVVGSRPCSERFFSGYSGFPLSSKTNISKFQLTLKSPERDEPIKYVFIYLFIYIRLTKESRQDIEVWLRFLESFNGRSFFLDERWENSSSLELFTDAAGSKGLIRRHIWHSLALRRMASTMAILKYSFSRTISDRPYCSYLGSSNGQQMCCIFY